MKQKNLAKRYLFFLIGLIIMSFGVAFSIKANLGTSPISSLPYVASVITSFTVGQTTMMLHCILILIQILVLRKRYEWIQLMQLPVAVIFGTMTDVAVWATGGIQYSAYWQQWILCAIGILLVAIGVSVEFTAGVVVLAGEGAVLAFAKVLPIKKSNMKIIFDLTLVGISLLLLFLFVGHLDGVREGTFVAAVMVGALTKKINPIMKKIEEKWIL